MADYIDRQAVIDSVKKEYNRRRTGDGLKLAWIEKAINDVPSASNSTSDGDNSTTQKSVNTTEV